MAVRVEEVVSAHDVSESIAPEPPVEDAATSPSLPPVVDAEHAEFSEGLGGLRPTFDQVYVRNLASRGFVRLPTMILRMADLLETAPNIVSSDKFA